MCSKEIPAARLKNSTAICGVEPLPGLANEILLGLALAAAICCLTLAYGALAVAEVTTATRPISYTGTRSRSASKGAGWYSAMLAASALDANINV